MNLVLLDDTWTIVGTNAICASDCNASTDKNASVSTSYLNSDNKC